MSIPSIVFHNERHTIHAESVSFGHHAFAESVRHMVRTKQAGHHNEDVEWDERKGNGIPSLEDEALMDEVCAFASRQGATSITCLADGSLDKGAKIAAAAKFILYAKSSRVAQIPRPLRVDLAFEIERAPLVCHVAGNDKEAKAYPEKECVDCEEGAIVEEDAGPANEGGDDAKRGGEGGDDEFGPVTDPDDVCISPNVKPGQQAK